MWHFPALILMRNKCAIITLFVQNIINKASLPIHHEEQTESETSLPIALQMKISYGTS